MSLQAFYPLSPVFLSQPLIIFRLQTGLFLTTCSLFSPCSAPRTDRYAVTIWLLRLFTIYLSDCFVFLVLNPFAIIPHGEHGCLPPEDFPSPPPIGWSTGFIATPLTLGMRPSHLALPALPRETALCSMLPICPIVAMQSRPTSLTSPEGSFTCAHEFSFASIWPEEPALLTTFPPAPFLNSRLCMGMPGGIFLSVRVLPGLISTSDMLDITISPTFNPFGQSIYLLSLSSYLTSAILEDLFGSYSM